MAIRLQIPEGAKRGLQELIALEPAQENELYTALKESPPCLTTRDMSSWVADKVKSIPAGDLRDIVSNLISLYSAWDIEDHDLDGFVEAIKLAAERSGIQASPEKLNKLPARLKKFLSLEETVGITAKALSVAYEGLRHYHAARILTDIRPVFVSDPMTEPSAVVLLHTLRVDLHEEGEDREWFVTMNSVDLLQLKNVIDRAIKKEETLVKMVEKSGKTVLKWG